MWHGSRMMNVPDVWQTRRQRRQWQWLAALELNSIPHVGGWQQ